ncbi:MAG: hypothetical protein B7Y45_13340 [Sphingomonas sp. 28-66-16]|nr:MAG: hypothetical protein B7Y45_13340 [Sphingomonas sp. 28-66-16]
MERDRFPAASMPTAASNPVDQRYVDERRAERLANARSIVDAGTHGFAIELVCLGCRRRRVIDAEPLYTLAHAKGWSPQFDALGPRLKCSSCGGAAKLTAIDAPADSPAIGPVTIADYRALLTSVANELNRRRRGRY